jgi:flagellar basal body-associated protein FliL
MKNIIIIFVVVIVFGVIIYLVTKKPSAQTATNTYNNNQASNPTAKLGAIIGNLTPDIIDFLKKKSASSSEVQSNASIVDSNGD